MNTQSPDYSRINIKDKLNTIYGSDVVNDDLLIFLPQQVYGIPTFVHPDENGNALIWHPSGKPANMSDEAKTDYENYVEESQEEQYKRFLAGYGGDLVVPTGVQDIYVPVNGFKNNLNVYFNGTKNTYLESSSGVLSSKSSFAPHPLWNQFNVRFQDRDVDINRLRVKDNSSITSLAWNDSKSCIILQQPDKRTYRNNPKSAWYSKKSLFRYTDSEGEYDQIFLDKGAGNSWIAYWPKTKLVGNLDNGFGGRYSFDQNDKELEAVIARSPFLGGDKYFVVSGCPRLTDIYVLGRPADNPADYYFNQGIVPYYDTTEKKYLEIKWHVLPWFKDDWFNSDYYIKGRYNTRSTDGYYVEEPAPTEDNENRVFVKGVIRGWIDYYYSPEDDITDYVDADIDAWISLIQKSPIFKQFITDYIRNKGYNSLVTERINNVNVTVDGFVPEEFEYNGEFDSVLQIERPSVPNQILGKLNFIQNQFNWSYLDKLGINRNLKGLSDYISKISINNKDNILATLLQDGPEPYTIEIPTDTTPIWDADTKTWKPFDTLYNYVLSNKQNLSGVKIGSNIKYIGLGLLNSTDSVTRIEVAEDNPTYSTQAFTIDENDQLTITPNSNIGIIWEKNKYKLDADGNPTTTENPFYMSVVSSINNIIPDGIKMMKSYSMYKSKTHSDGQIGSDTLEGINIYIPSSCTKFAANWAGSDYLESITLESYLDYFKKMGVSNSVVNPALYISDWRGGVTYKNMFYYDENGERIAYWDSPMIKDKRILTYTENGRTFTEEVGLLKIPDEITQLYHSANVFPTYRIELNNVQQIGDYILQSYRTIEVIIGDLIAADGSELAFNVVPYSADGIMSRFNRQLVSIEGIENIDRKVEYRSLKQYLNSTLHGSSWRDHYDFNYYHLYLRVWNEMNHSIDFGNDEITEIVIKDDDLPTANYALVQRTYINRQIAGAAYISRIVLPPNLGAVSVGSFWGVGCKTSVTHSNIEYNTVLDFSNVLKMPIINDPFYGYKFQFTTNYTYAHFPNSGTNFILIPDYDYEGDKLSMDYTDYCIKQWGEIVDEDTLVYNYTYLSSGAYIWTWDYKNSRHWKYENGEFSTYFLPKEGNEKWFADNYNKNLTTLEARNALIFMTAYQFQTIVNPEYSTYDYTTNNFNIPPIATQVEYIYTPKSVKNITASGDNGGGCMIDTGIKPHDEYFTQWIDVEPYDLLKQRRICGMPRKEGYIFDMVYINSNTYFSWAHFIYGQTTKYIPPKMDLTANSRYFLYIYRSTRQRFQVRHADSSTWHYSLFYDGLNANYAGNILLGNNMYWSTTTERFLYYTPFYGAIYQFTIRHNSQPTSLTDTGPWAMNLIPVKVGDIGYMFDKITGKLFRSVTGTDFLPGPEVS